MRMNGTLAWLAALGSASGLSACMLLADFSGYQDTGPDAGPGADAGPDSMPTSEPDSGPDAARPPPLSYQLGGAFRDTVLGMDLDADGNVYLLVVFKGQMNVRGEVYKVNADEQGLVMVKLDPSGLAIWSKIVAITTDLIEFNADLRVKKSPIIVGSFGRVVDVGHGLTTSLGIRDLFVAMLSPDDGAFLWGKTFGAPGAKVAAMGVDVGESGRVGVTGYFTSAPVDLGNNCVMTTNDATETPFAAVYDAQGGCVWARAFGGVGDAFGNRIAVDSADALIFTGRFKGAIDLGGSLGMLTAKSVDSIADGYLVKLDAAGEPAFGKLLAPMGTVRLSAVGQDILLAGTVADKLWFDPSPAFGGGTDMLVARLDPQGTPTWSRLLGGAGDDSVALAIDPLGRLVLAGSIQGQVNVGSTALSSAGGSDAFIGALDGSGEPLPGAKRFGDAADQAIDFVRVDVDGSRLVAGHFQGTIDLGTGPLTSRGDADVFVARLPPASP